MKPLAEKFDKNGFHFELRIREQDIAIFRKTRILDGGVLSEQNITYELVRIRKSADYEMAGVVIPAHESLPASNSWGVDGVTLMDEERALQLMEVWLKEKPVSPILGGEPTGAPRGRKAFAFELEVPKDSPFMVKDLVAKYPNVALPLIVTRLNGLRQNGTVTVIGTKPSASGRGKPCNIFRAISKQT